MYIKAIIREIVDKKYINQGKATDSYMNRRTRSNISILYF